MSFASVITAIGSAVVSFASKAFTAITTFMSEMDMVTLAKLGITLGSAASSIALTASAAKNMAAVRSSATESESAIERGFVNNYADRRNQNNLHPGMRNVQSIYDSRRSSLENPYLNKQARLIADAREEEAYLRNRFMYDDYGNAGLPTGPYDPEDTSLNEIFWYGHELDHSQMPRRRARRRRMARRPMPNMAYGY